MYQVKKTLDRLIKAQKYSKKIKLKESNLKNQDQA